MKFAVELCYNHNIAAGRYRELTSSILFTLGYKIRVSIQTTSVLAL